MFKAWGKVAWAWLDGGPALPPYSAVSGWI